MICDGGSRFINYRPLLFIAAGLILGVLACGIGGGICAFERTESGVEIVAIVAVTALFVLGALLSVLAVVYKRKGLLVFSVAFMMGILRVIVAVPDYYGPGEYPVSGTVAQISVKDQTAQVVITQARVGDRHIGYNAVIECHAHSVIAEVGDKVSAYCKGGTPNIAFGTYDKRASMLAEGNAFYGTADSIAVVEKGHSLFYRTFGKARTCMTKAVNEMFRENAGIVSAFLLGDRTGINDMDMESFRAAGTLHLLSLSGFHVDVLTGMLLALIPKRKTATRLVIVSVFVLGYCFTTNFSASLVRASVMCLTALIAEVISRRNDSLSSMSLAAVILIAVNPFSLYSVGFQLSFAAVFGIILLESGTFRIKNRAVGYVANSAAVTLGANSAVLFISAKYFAVIQIYSLFANLIVVPLFSLLLPICAVLLILYAISPTVAVIMANVPSVIIGGTLKILHGIAELPGAVLTVTPPSDALILVAIITMCLLSQYVLRPFKTRLKYGLCGFALFTAVMITDIIVA